MIFEQLGCEMDICKAGSDRRFGAVVGDVGVWGFSGAGL